MPSKESTKLATDLVNNIIKDGALHNSKVMVELIAEALDKSWSQGIADAKLYQRINVLREQLSQ